MLQCWRLRSFSAAKESEGRFVECAGSSNRREDSSMSHAQTHPASRTDQTLLRRSKNLQEQAFARLALEGRSGQEMSSTLGLTFGAVYAARHRAQRRVQEEVAKLRALDGEGEP